MGNRTASVVMVCEMLPCFTAAAWTVTMGCGSACSLEQPVRQPAAIASAPQLIVLRMAMQLKDAGKRLQISDCQPVPGFPVIIIVARRYERILRIHHFQRG